MHIVHNSSGIIVASSTKLPTDKLWPSFDISSNPTSISPTANIMVRHEINADFIEYTHACFGSPPDSSMIRSLKLGYLENVDRITTKMFSDNMPNAIATAKGHLDQSRQGIQSTSKRRASHQKQQKPTSEDIHDESDFGREQHEQVATFKVIKANENSSDLTGKFPFISRRGYSYMLISIYRGYIHVELMKDKSAAEYIRAMRLTYLFFSTKGHKPAFQSLDNETSTVIEAFLKEEAKVTFQYVPSSTHRRLRAERAIRSWKNHFLATLATADAELPKNIWDEFIAQAELTLAHLRAYTINPAISSYEGIYGSKHNFSAHPINVLGVRTVALTPADKRESWAPHGIDCFYIGAALQHYRCHRVYVPATNDIRITDSLSWHQTKTFAPGASKEELIYDKQVELLAKLDAIQISIAHNPTHANDPSLQQLIADARTSIPAPSQRVADPAPSQRVVSDIPPAHPTESTARERRAIIAAEKAQQTANPTDHFYKPLPRNKAVKPHLPFFDYKGRCFTDTADKTHFQITDVVISTAAGVPSTKRGRKGKIPVATPFFKHFDTKLYSSAPLRTSDYEYTPCEEIVAWHKTRKSFCSTPKHIKWDTVDEEISAANISLAFSAGTSSLGTKYLFDVLSSPDTYDADSFEAFANSTFHSSPDDPRLNINADGTPLTMRSALRGPDGDKWELEQGKEFTRLLSTGTISPILRNDQPSDRRKDTTYYNPQVKEKLDADKNITRRVRGTLGGDRINFPGETTSPVADIAAVKILLTSVVSDRLNHGTDTKFATLDLDDFYLGGDNLPRPEYCRVKLKDIPLETIALHSLEQYIENDEILFQVDGSMYGHPVAGRVCNQDLVKHLATHGYIQDDIVPCLFSHVSNGIQFTLIVDDLGIKHIDGTGALEHLKAAIELKWKTKLDRSGAKYVGIRIDWHYNAKVPHFYIDMPTTVPDAIKRFCPNGPPRKNKSPIKYIPPLYGAKSDLGATVDTSPPVSAADKLFIQQVAGVFLYYGRMVDITMLPAVRAISEACANPTAHTLAATHHLLGYAHAHPNNRVRFDACDMILTIQSDASHLSQLRSGGVAGGIHYLTNKKSPFTLNGTITATCCRIPTVCVAASESEYAALYINGQQGIFQRECLRAVGYPQQPTPIYCDNSTAIQIANDTCKMRRSKSIEARYHWIRCRVRRHIYKVAYLAGSEIDADFLTKTQPVKRHIYFSGRLVHPPEKDLLPAKRSN